MSVNVVQPRTYPVGQHTNPQFANPQFGLGITTPFSVILQNNQVLNRAFLSTFGILPANIIAARNRYEKIEKALDETVWILLALLAPIFLEAGLSRHFSNIIKNHRDYKAYFTATAEKPISRKLPFINRLNERIGRLGKSSVFRLPWNWLSANHHLDNKELTKAEPMLKHLGLKKPEHIRELLKNPKFLLAIRRGKFAIITADMLLIIMVGIVTQWGKNLLTKSLSGKQGFSGEFNYASETYLKTKTQGYESEKKKRFLRSMLIDVLGLAALPLGIYGLIKARRPGPLIQKLKQKLLPLFDYTNAIFMSKWVILYACIPNWIVLGSLAARDSHERREHLIRSSTVLFFYTIGDDIFGKLGRRVIKKLYPYIEKSGISLLKKSPLGFKIPVPLRELLEHKKIKGNTSHKAYKLARKNFWFSLIAATVLVGLSVQLLNNVFTRKKVTTEEQRLKANHPPATLKLNSASRSAEPPLTRQSNKPDRSRRSTRYRPPYRYTVYPRYPQFYTYHYVRPRFFRLNRSLPYVTPPYPFRYDRPTHINRRYYQ